MASKFRNNYLPEIRALWFRPGKPRMVTVNLTRQCNQRCLYCEIGAGLPSETSTSLNRDDLVWIIDQMASTGIPKLSLCGGEPLLFNGLFDIILYAREKGIRTSVTTNGMSLFSLEEREIDILRFSGTDINLSMDSFEPTIHNLTRGHSKAHENALKSIVRLQEAGIPVTMLTAISKYNFHQLLDTVTEAYRRGIREIIFQPLITHSNYPDREAITGKPALNLDPGEIPVLMEQLERIQAYESKHRIITNVYRIMPWISTYLDNIPKSNDWFFGSLLPKFYCREIFGVIDIAYDGGIQPCGLARASMSIKGNRPKDLVALWEEATASIREDMSAGRYREYCNGCCHKFSRNMIASMIRYPLQNRKTLARMLPALVKRAINTNQKKQLLKK